MRRLILLAGLTILAAPIPPPPARLHPDIVCPPTSNWSSAPRSSCSALYPGDFEPDSGERQMIGVEPVEALKGAMPTAPIALPRDDRNR